MRVPITIMLLAVALAGCAESEPVLDADGDGYTDAEERAAGSDPHNATSVPVVETVENTTHAPQWGEVASAAIRPGAPIGWCTYNFLFFAPANGTYYIGTAAHCTDELGQRMPLSGYADEIGTVVYDSDNATESNTNADFSLIELDPELNLEAHPQVVNRGGPTGFATAADVEVGDVIEHHGYGMVFGDFEETRDRDGILSSWGDDYCSESPIWWGDSGSPILHADTGKALGIVSRAGWIDCVPTAQLMGATLPYIFRELEEYGWGGVELATI